MLTLRSFLVLAFWLFSLSSPARADTLGGGARVVDGDTLKLAGQTIRLYGIDAPELSQTCRQADGAVWSCGIWSRDRLAALVGGQRLRCDVRDRDRYGRLVARCDVPAGDLGALMVADGAAFAYRRYALDYVDAEKRAAVAGVGVWVGPAERPEDVRAAGGGRSALQSAPQSVPSPDRTPPPRGRCVIKGNISGNGRLYHVPGGHSYAATRIDTAAGERWFCTEAEARAAGWRKAAD